MAAKNGDFPYTALWCEHHEDFLAQRGDDVFDAYQIKTSRPELGAWKITDIEMTKSIRRFVDLVTEFGDRIGNLNFVSNTEFEEITPAARSLPALVFGARPQLLDASGKWTRRCRTNISRDLMVTKT